MNINTILKCAVLLVFSTVVCAQGEELYEDHSYKPLTLKLNEDGSKYMRLIMWHQIWVTSSNLSNDSKLQLSASIRRSRMLAYAQVSSKFLILSHFGLNSLNAENLSSLGSNGDASKLFLHGAWGEYKINNHFYIGGGLHYWKGLTRLASQSTLNFMTLDQSRPFYAWHSLGITDQFARHLGLYMKGSAGKFEYRIAWNTAGRNPLGGGRDYSLDFAIDGEGGTELSYTGASVPDADGNPIGNSIFEGYVKYNIWENESVKLPYYVGTYLGKKKVLAVGAGFFLHPDGMYNTDEKTHSNVGHFAADVFLDMPLLDGALNAYASFQKFNYGSNYISRWAGTGNAFYAQAGYYISRTRLMPYLAYSNGDFEGADESIHSMDFGLNYFINEHHAKITLEYHRIVNDYRENDIVRGVNDALSQLRLQLHFYL